MKIAFIYDAVYPFVTGGAEKRVYELANRLAKRGHEVHWYGIGWWWPEKGQIDIEMDGIHLHGVCKSMDLYIGGKRSTKEAVYFALNLFPVLMKEKFDVVDCQSFPYFSCFTAKLYSLLRRTTLFITWIEVWDDYWYEYLGKIGLFGKTVEKLTTYLTGEVSAISRKTKNDLKSMGVNKEINVVPVGIDMKEIERVEPSKCESDVIFAGRLIENKNVDILVKAIKLVKREHPEIKCVIIGDGPERNNLEKLVKNLKVNDNIVFTGFIENHDEIISYMKSSKLFILPSTREGFGIVVIEANACGLPVVVINHEMNAATDLIEHNESGFISNLSAEEIANYIVNGISKKEKMQEKCIKNAEQYNWDEIVNSLERFYIKNIE